VEGAGAGEVGEPVGEGVELSGEDIWLSWGAGDDVELSWKTQIV
jgi:hypothetical protein